jgi:hypothetical protein
VKIKDIKSLTVSNVACASYRFDLLRIILLQTDDRKHALVITIKWHLRYNPLHRLRPCNYAAPTLCQSPRHTITQRRRSAREPRTFSPNAARHHIRRLGQETRSPDRVTTTCRFFRPRSRRYVRTHHLSISLTSQASSTPTTHSSGSSASVSTYCSASSPS